MSRDAQPPASSPRLHDWRVVLLTVSPIVVSLIENRLRERGHNPVALIIPAGPNGTRPQDDVAWTSMRYLLEAASPSLDILIASRRSQLAPLIAAAKPDLIISFFFPW